MKPSKGNTIDSHVKKILMALCDVAMLIVSFLCAKIVLAQFFSGVSPLPGEWKYMLLLAVSYLFVTALYPSVVLRPFVRIDEVAQNLFYKVFIHFFVFVASLSLLGLPMSHSFLAVLYAIFVVLLWTENKVIFRMVKKKRAKAQNRAHVVLIGSPSTLSEFIYTLSHRTAEVCVDGFFSEGEADLSDAAMPCLGGVEDIIPYLSAHPETETIYCDCESLSFSAIQPLHHYCKTHSLEFVAIPGSINQLPCVINAEQVYGNILLRSKLSPLHCVANRFVKRFFDLLLSVVFLLIVFPFVYIVVALILKRKSPGPVFVRRTYHGAGAKKFSTFEFRTHHASPSLGDAQDEAFPFGAFLLRTRISRLPMFFNVLLGSMSVVGPSLPQVDAFARNESTSDCDVSILKPALTGWTPLHSLANPALHEGEVSEERMQKDTMWYAQNWSFWLDVHIVLRALRLFF